MDHHERKLAIQHIKTAFTEGTQCPVQQGAVLETVKPRHFNQFTALFEASGITNYPETHEERAEKAASILTGFMKSGSAPKAVVDFAAGGMAPHLTVTHQHRINNAFAPK